MRAGGVHVRFVARRTLPSAWSVNFAEMGPGNGDVPLACQDEDPTEIGTPGKQMARGGTAVRASVSYLLILPLQSRGWERSALAWNRAWGWSPQVSTACHACLSLSALLLLARRRHSAHKSRRGLGICTRQCGV